MTERRPQPQAPEGWILGRVDAPASVPLGATERERWEWWWAGRLAALHRFLVQECPHGGPGEPRRQWLAGFIAGAGVTATPLATASPNGDVGGSLPLPTALAGAA